MLGLTCPNCKTDKHEPRYEKMGFYVCSTCGKVLGYLCKGCDKLYLDNQTIKCNGQYVCRHCLTPHYGYTTWKNTEWNKKG